MQFVRVQTLLDGVAPLVERLTRQLANGKNVTWLIPGGSNIPLSVAVMAQLDDGLTAGLTIMLSDERYGPVGHADSNTFQLAEAGFQSKQANLLPVLHDGLSLEETSRRYAADFEDRIRSNDIIIGQFGMGADGHIAGILPQSPAVGSADLATGYDAGNFVRVTLTPKALQQITVGYVFAFGEAKRDQLERLQSQAIELDLQPVQIIKQLPEAFVYNDQLV